MGTGDCELPRTDTLVGFLFPLPLQVGRELTTRILGRPFQVRNTPEKTAMVVCPGGEIALQNGLFPRQKVRV